MSAKTSKEVWDRQNFCRLLLSALRLQGPSVSAVLTGLVRPFLREGDPVPDFQAVITSFVRALQEALKRLVKADEVLFSLNAKTRTLRRRRNQKIQDLIRLLASLRQSIASHYVAPDLSQIGFEDRTPRNLTPIFRQIDRVATSLGHEGLVDLLGEPFFKQSSFDPREHVAELKEEAETGRVLNEDLAEARRELDAAVLAKESLMESYDHLEIRTARPFEDFCRLAGENKLADRVRPTIRRPEASPLPDDAAEDPQAPTEGPEVPGETPSADETASVHETAQDGASSA